jgi:hypothetical protein
VSDAASPARLLVHIGMGKTGTSSIQETLKAGRETLARHGVSYLGLILEHAETQRYGWQVPLGSPGFFARRDRESAALELRNVLAEELRRLGAQGTGLAIWSNEWIFGRHRHVLPGLLRLKQDGFDIRIVCWIRRIDGWARSAYVEWGVKEKPAPGPVQPFAAWAQNRDFGVHRSAEPWAKAFGAEFLLRNYDAEPDVVAAFRREFLPDIPLQPVRRNEAPYPALLAAWLLHNSRQPGPVSPLHFQRSWHRAGLSRPAPAPRLSAVMPDETTLAALRERYAEDTAQVNGMLEAQGQAPIDLATPLRPVAEPDPWEMQALLLRMVTSLQEQVDELRKELAEAKKG